jgi:hypothetical protein
MSESTFYRDFKENMESLGLPAPETLFATVTVSTSTIAAIVGSVEKFGVSVTIAEIVGAGILSEKLLVVASVTAAFYAGACIGSLMVALEKKSLRMLSDGAVKSTLLRYAIEYPSWLQSILIQNRRFQQTRAAYVGKYHFSYA